MKFYALLFSLLSCLNTVAFAQVTVTIDPTKDVKTISQNIYGRNNALPKESYVPALTAAQLTQLRESGIQFLRESGGNNATKYNWKRRLSSHPDWYNNVYENDWDKAAKQLRDDLPASVTGMWTFPLIGKVAKTNTANFNDWSYNGSTWWSGVNQNLAGGGVVNAAGGNMATTIGNPNLYLEDWTADSTTDILPYWFNTLGIPQARATYWNMDNEPEIWNGTHDDIVSSSLSPETYMQTYFETAKKARAKFPAIKLVGPVPANEWQWYNWMNRITGSNGQYYPWLEYFIKRCAEEQATSGVRLLDVLDIHFYPTETATDDIVQLHRVFFDRTYNYPGANGVKSKSGTWDNTQTKEYIFGRINDWLVQYMGANHGVKLGLTEIDVESSNPSVVATWYASMLGEFMKNEVELFSPWSWKTGMWETVHLFSRYNKTSSVQGVSTDENAVSAYPSVNAAKNEMTVVLVNRSSSATKSTALNFANFIVSSTTAPALRLSALGTTETFVSHTQNALQASTVAFANNTATISLPPLSVTSLTFSGQVGTYGAGSNTWSNPDFENDVVNWNPTTYAPAATTYAIITTGQQQGAKALRATVTAVGANPWNPQLVRNQFDVTAGESYTLKFWAKADAARRIDVIFQHPTTYVNASSTSVTTNTNWTQHTWTFVASSTQPLVLALNFGYATGTYYFDNFEFSKNNTAVLPVEIIDFQAIGNTKDKSVNLNWSVASERHLKNYTIERSLDSKQFEAIGEVVAKNDPLSINYVFEDKTPIDGVNYYRLKINEQGGRIKYSTIKAVTIGNKKPITILPNPSFGTIQLINAEGFERLDIYDLHGRLVRTFSSKTTQFDVSDLAKGVYQVAIKANGVLSFTKMVKM